MFRKLSDPTEILEFDKSCMCRLGSEIVCSFSLAGLLGQPPVLSYLVRSHTAPLFARVCYGLRYLTLMTSCEAAGPVVSPMRKVRLDASQI